MKTCSFRVHNLAILLFTLPVCATFGQDFTSELQVPNVQVVNQQDGLTPTKVDTVPPAKPDAPAPKQDAELPPDKRVLGVLPNYRTVNETDVFTPISAGHKMLIATKDSFDYPLVLLAAAYGGLGQLTNENPSFGQGVKGYAHRWATNYADQAICNMLTEGIMPSLLREDPRYHRLGASRGGSVGHRTWYALTRVFVTYTDKGTKRFNYSEWVGNGIGVAISNSYYPDGRNVEDNVTRLLTQVGTDAVSQVLKEFWPDIKQKWFHKKSPADSH